MPSFTQKLSLMLKGELERILAKLLDQGPSSFIDEEDFQKLVIILQNKNPKYKKREAFDLFLKQVKEQTRWPEALRSLMTIHKLIHTIGGDFISIFGPQKIENISKFPTDKTNIKTLVHSAMVVSYYTYLQKLGYNYADFSICFFAKNNLTEKLVDNNLSLLHFLSKLQNILNHLIKLLPLIEASLDQFKDVTIVKQLCYFCLTDSFHYYTYINKIITHMTKEIYKLMEDDAVFLYEMYSEHIQMTKKLQDLFSIKNQIPEFPIPQPEFYTLDLQFNRDLELHILSLKKGITQRSGGSKNNEPNVIHEETRLSFRPTVSTADLSGIIPQISGVGLNPYEKQLFSPPIFQRRKSSHHTPQIICSKTATEQNADDDEEEKEAPSKRKVEGGPSNNNYLKAPQATDPFKMNFLQIPNESQIYLQKNHRGGLYNALDVSSPNMSSNSSFTDSYIVG